MSSNRVGQEVVLLAPEAPSNPASDPWPAPDDERRGRHAGESLEARGKAPWDRRSAGPISPPEIDPKPQANDGASGNQAHPVSSHGHPMAVAVAVLVLAAAAAGGSIYWDYAGHFQSTDDAFVSARQFAVAPKVSGNIAAVPVTDNQHVVAGDVIARIDDRDYRFALEQAEAQVASAEASIKNIDAQIVVQQAQISANQAQVEQAQASLVFAQQEAVRYQDLEHKGAGTAESAQQFVSQLHQQEAVLKTSQASLNVAQRQIEALNAQRNSAVAGLAQAKAQSDQAQLNLSYTSVTAAQAGRVVNLTAAVGQFAQAGTSLTMFVPDETWVTANFKETQLAAMRPGQPASMRIDAYPDRAIRGHVASVQPGSGTAFSLLPAENATEITSRSSSARAGENRLRQSTRRRRPWPGHGGRAERAHRPCGIAA